VIVHFCGVRGSTPAPGAEYSEIGGHTSCVALAHDGEPPTLIVDAGTGIRRVGELLGDAAFRGTIMLGHLHWDHTCGLPFFAAADRPDAVVDLRLPEQGRDALALLAENMGPPHFPITPAELRGAWTFGTYDEGPMAVEAFDVLALEIPHKGGRTMGLRISDGTASIAYLSDHAPHDLGPGPHGFGAYHPAALALADGVDLLIHDGQYTAAELPARAGWGHAAADYVAGLVEAAGAKRAVLFHHDPSRTDEQVWKLAAAVGIEPAIEGTSLRLSATGRHPVEAMSWD
jgi:phosphoribosyl 1,2-cyclic phosphodiesterase